MNKNMYYKKLKTRIIILLTLVTATVISQTQEQKIDKLLHKYVDLQQFNGSVLVAHKGDIIHQKGYGYANFEWHIKNTPETKFRIASITKQFTAMLVMLAVQDHKLQLDKPLIHYMSDYPKKTGNQVTAHYLLTHTAGIPDISTVDNYFDQISYLSHTPQELIELFWHKELEFKPGTQFNYSNAGYMILGALLERIYGQSFDTLLAERIFQPLTMKNSGYDRSADVLTHRASGYVLSGHKVINADYKHMTVPYAAGAIYSTVGDMYLWDQALYNYTLLSKKLTEQMFTPLKANYAYGWEVEKQQYSDGKLYPMLAHSGAINGFSTVLRRYTNDKQLIVLLDNRSGQENEKIANNIFNILNNYTVEEPQLSLSQVALTTKGQALLDALHSRTVNKFVVHQIAYQLLNDKRPNDAILLFRYNTENHPTSTQSFIGLGKAYENSGDKKKAISAFMKAHTLNSTMPEPIEGLTRLGIKIDSK